MNRVEHLFSRRFIKYTLAHNLSVWGSCLTSNKSCLFSKYLEDTYNEKLITSLNQDVLDKSKDLPEDFQVIKEEEVNN